MKIDPQELALAAVVQAQALSAMDARSAEHEQARSFWTETPELPPAMTASHAQRMDALPGLLAGLGPLNAVLDVGCGDGEVAVWLGETAGRVRGLDISAQRIARAQERAAAAGLNRLHFVQTDVEVSLPEGEHDLVCCLQLLGCLVDDKSWHTLLQQLVQRVKPGSYLLTQDTVMLGAQAQRLGQPPRHWRTETAYQAAFAQAGLRLVRSVELPAPDPDSAQRLWLWQRSEDFFQEPVAEDPPTAAPQAAAPDASAMSPMPLQALVSDIANQQNQQSEVMLNIGNFLCHLGERLQAIESQLAAPPAVDNQPLLARLDRLESTLHWALRRPHDPTSGPIRVAFLIHHAAAWSSLRGIVDAMQAEPGFAPVIVSLPHRFPVLGELGGEADVHQMLKDQGYAHVRVTDGESAQALERLKQLNPAVVFRQAPWDADVPACLQAQHLGFTKLCYVPYGYMTARIEKQQFDQAYHRLCWRIFCPDQAHLELFAQHNLQAGNNCRVTGYPKFDHLLRHRDTAGHWPVPAAGKTRAPVFRLIWAPHFSYEGQWLRFGVFDRMAEQMLAFVAARPQLEVVLRPHPAMREAMSQAAADSALGHFRERWQALPNTGYSTEQEYADLFAASHAMLTDGLSFFSEYQLFDKPLVFFERQGHAGFNPAGERLLDGMYRLQSFGTFETLMARLMKGLEDPAVVAARRRIAAAVHPYPGEAARRIVDVIRNEITQG